MSDATMRAAIAARLTAMGAAIGRVHDYERWAATPAQFLALFQDEATNKIFGWEIVRLKTRAQKITLSRWKLVHRYLIRGYYGLQDAAATEKTVHALVDQIMLDFMLTKISGTQGEQHPEAAVETRMFGHVLCHVAEIILPEVAEIVAPTPETAPDLTGIDIDYYLTPGDEAVDASDSIEFVQES